MFSCIHKNNAFWRLLCITFAAFYASIFLIHPQLGPTDDFVFLKTLQTGKPLLYYSQSFPYYDAINLGRFTPIVSMEYNLMGIFSRNPFAYFLYHAIQYLLFVFIFIKLLKHFSSNTKFIYLTSIAFSLFPGFAIAWFRLQLPERNVIFFSVLMLLSLFALQKMQKWRYGALAFLFANIAIYYKETAFILVGTYVFFYLLFSWKKQELQSKIVHISLAASAALYAIIYYFYVFLRGIPFIFRFAIEHPFIFFIKTLLNFGFFSDPILILLLLPYTAVRLYAICIQKNESRPVEDSMLLAGTMYVIAFFVLRLYGPYYLLPAYIFAIPPLLSAFARTTHLHLFWKAMLVLTALALLLNAIPAGIHYIGLNKYLPVNFNAMLDFLKNDIISRYPHARANIFLDGVDRGDGRGTYFILGEFLESKGLASSQFDLKSSIEASNPAPFVSKIQPDYTVFKEGPLPHIQFGDYLIVTPQNTSRSIDASYISSLEKDYSLLFQTKSPFALPLINAKTLVKYLLKRNAASDSSALIANNNITESSDYYVFIKR